MDIILRYLPKSLSAKDRRQQKNMLSKSRRLYKKGIYYTRKNLKSFTTHKSKHVRNAMRLYKVDHIGATDKLSKASGCSKHALGEISRKGEGAYYSSGSRPNQTAQSWGIARLASAITSGKAAAVDFKILQKGCKSNSRALRLAKHKRGRGTRRVPRA
jgi:hypothetical protein